MHIVNVGVSWLRHREFDQPEAAPIATSDHLCMLIPGVYDTVIGKVLINKFYCSVDSTGTLFMLYFVSQVVVFCSGKSRAEGS